MALLGEPHPHSAYVMHPGVACRIPVPLIDEMRRDDRRVTERIFRDWHQAIADADRILGEFGKGPARARLARLLAEFKREGLIDEEKRRCVDIDAERLGELARCRNQPEG